MRIAVFHNITTGGAKRALHGFVRQLHAQGHSLDVFVPACAGEDEYLPLRPWARSVRIFPLPRWLWPIQPHRPYWTWDPLTFASKTLRKIAPLDRAQRDIAREIDDGGYDWVYVDQDFITFSPPILRYLRTPKVYYCHQPYRSSRDALLERLHWMDSSPSHVLSLRRRFWKRVVHRIGEIDRLNAQGAGLILTNSYFTRELILGSYGLDAAVARIGIDTSLFRPLRSEKAHAVLSVGAMMRPKGFDWIVKALGLIPEASRPGLILVSDRQDPTYRKSLEQLAGQRHVRVEIHSGVVDSKLVSLYNQAKVFSYAAYLEPLGLAPLEAMACGTPVVAVREGGVRESVVDGVTGHLVDRNEAALAEAIRSLLDNANARERMGRQGMQHVQQLHNWSECGQQFTRLINRWRVDHP